MELDRRAVLRGAAGVAGVGALGVVGGGALGGCANSGSSDVDTVRSGQSIVALDEVPVGGVASVTIDRRPAFVARPDAETVRAFSAICTHQGCTVISAGEILLCPCHQSHYEPLTGAVTRGPAEKDLPSIDVHIEDGQVVSGAAS